MEERVTWQGRAPRPKEKVRKAKEGKVWTKGKAKEREQTKEVGEEKERDMERIRGEKEEKEKGCRIWSTMSKKTGRVYRSAAANGTLSRRNTVHP